MLFCTRWGNHELKQMKMSSYNISQNVLQSQSSKQENKYEQIFICSFVKSIERTYRPRLSPLLEESYDRSRKDIIINAI